MRPIIAPSSTRVATLVRRASRAGALGELKDIWGDVGGEHAALTAPERCSCPRSGQTSRRSSGPPVMIMFPRSTPGGPRRKPGSAAEGGRFACDRESQTSPQPPTHRELPVDSTLIDLDDDGGAPRPRTARLPRTTPAPSTRTVASSVITTRRALPNVSGLTSWSVTPASSAITWPPVKAARSCRCAIRDGRIREPGRQLPSGSRAGCFAPTAPTPHPRPSRRR